jgi:phosphatidylserine decarboxylase
MRSLKKVNSITMKGENVRTAFQSWLPQHALSRFAGFMARCQQPWLKNWLIRDFIRRYQVDMRIAVKENGSDYRNFNEFFTRALKPEIRPIASASGAIVSPVDGCVSEFGDLKQNILLQAKNKHYELPALLGGSVELAAQFRDGKFATFYLAPRDYHRVHSPCAATLQAMWHVPGELFSVNTHTAETLPNLFVRNERVITLFETQWGSMAVILVGAMLVASIATTWAGRITPAGKRQIQHWTYPNQNIILAKGAELGHFELGSTVILLFSPTWPLHWAKSMQRQKKVQFGECIGECAE